ncbi:MAG TPA: GldG family protein, partial [Candidatus Woesebacteria bacterium]|nr:GldG family protein [Candidatus Woesebacteria bacterium]
MRIPKLTKYLHIQNTSRDIVVGASIVLLVAVNILISGVSVRLDLSRGKAYSLSASTQKILASLKDPVEITFFLSDNIPSSFLTTKNQVNDLLVEYRRGSSQVSLSYVDPRKQGQQAAQEYGIQEVQFSQLAQDEYAVSSGYFSIGVQSNGQKIAIQQLDPTNLEYTITSIIYKVSQPEEVTVGLAGIAPSFGGQFGASSPESFNVLTQILGQQFTLANFDGANESAEYKTLVVLDGLSSPLTDEMTEQIDAYVKEGGKIIAFTSGVDIGEDMMAASRESKLAPLVSSFGMRVNTDLVLSNQAEIVNFSNDFFNRGKYPFWLMTNVFNP